MSLYYISSSFLSVPSRQTGRRADALVELINMAMMQQQQDDPMHSCEICGVSGLTDEEIRIHTRKNHVDGKGQCPFCGLNDVRNESELLLHVNQAHLDYLTPDNESPR